MDLVWGSKSGYTRSPTDDTGVAVFLKLCANTARAGTPQCEELNVRRKERTPTSLVFLTCCVSN